MPWREVPTSSSTIDMKKQPAGFSVEGIYKGHREFQTQYGEQVVWEFRGREGDFGIYGASNLNFQMGSLSEGTLTRVTYMGKKQVELKRGKVSMHIFKVEIDDDGVDPTIGVPRFDPEEIPA